MRPPVISLVSVHAGKAGVTIPCSFENERWVLPAIITLPTEYQAHRLLSLQPSAATERINKIHSYSRVGKKEVNDDPFCMW